MSKLEHLKADKKVKVMSLFGAVWGIGPSTAQKLYDKGHRSLEDLKMDTSLTPAQRVGLEFHEDIIKRIPRHEVKEMEAIVQKAAAELRPNISVVCGGSYRRGKATVGDLDIVITHPDGHSHTGLMNELLAKLKNEGFLAEDLMHGHQHSTEVILVPIVK
jgi:DNA polymerase lambda